MTRRINTRRAVLTTVALLLAGCQPSVLCDPGQIEMGGGCFPKPVKDAGAGPVGDASSVADGGDTDGGSDGGSDAEKPDSCPGDRYQGFGQTCTASSACGCHAPDCATAPLQYCTKLNCDPSDASACPPSWTCLMIPAGASPDPSIKSLCLKP